MTDRQPSRNAIVTRRNAIRVGIAGGIGLIAGCGSNSGDTGNNTDGGNGNGNGNGSDTAAPGVSDVRFTELDRQGTPPAQRHFNPWNPAINGCWFPGQVAFDRLAVYSPAANENYGIIAQSWEMPEEGVLEVELSDEWTWHNGDQFVAEDWVMQYQIEKAIAEFQADAGTENPTIYNSIEAVDDTFIRIELNQPLSTKFAVRKTIAQGQGNIGRGTFTKHDDDRWSSWHDTLRNGSESEIQSAIEEITTTSYPSIQDAIGNGAFQITEVGDDTILMERYDDHPNIDNINFREYAYFVPANIGEVFQPYANGIVDATSKGFPVQEDLRSQLPNETTLFREALSSNKLFAFNLGAGDEIPDSIVSNRNVRRAMAHVFDRQQVSQILQGVNRLFEYPPCRVPGKVMQEGTSDAAQFVNENLVTYGKNNTERAAELLRREGFEQNDNNNWFTPDGEPFQVEFLNVATRPDHQVLIKNLKDFGVLVQQENVDSATFDQRRKNGNYDVIPDGSSANGIFAMWQESLIVDWVMNTLTHTPETMEIPMPIGDPDGSSGTKEINIPEHINQWLITGEDRYHHELMWWWNQTLPEMEAMYQPDAGALNGQNWQFNGVPSDIVNGLDDALSVATKLEEGALEYTG
jgi:peptide/nickel transport system substrate-binding protein